MSPQTLVDQVRRQPFQPFRIHLTNGRSYEIHHPELIKVGRSIAVVYFPAIEDSAIFERFDTLSLLHITGLQPLETANASPD